jgi:hypothetical protein
MPKTPAQALTPKAKRSISRGVPTVKRGGTTGGRLAIAILGGLAVGLVAMVIYGMADWKSDWAFNRPAAQLPSLQSKHTLQ